jgi:hypothetical protein
MVIGVLRTGAAVSEASVRHAIVVGSDKNDHSSTGQPPSVNAQVSPTEIATHLSARSR